MVEQNAENWWEAIRKTIYNSIRIAKIDRDDIIGTSITNQRETIVPVDIDGNPTP